MWIVSGLGNPGKKYEHTRHNLGFKVADILAEKLGYTFKKSQNCFVAEGFIGSEKIILIKPLTFMNLSGQAVRSILSYFKCGIDRLIVVHDDLDMDIGKLKIKWGGGSGGHNGIESIIASLDSKDFLRIKIGIGKPETGTGEGYVLGKLSKDEEGIIRPVVQRASDAIETIVSEGKEKAMNTYNAD